MGTNTRLEARLPKELRPGKIASLVRVGRDNDGGYVLDRRNLEHSEILVGLGVNDDWSFEQNFLDIRKIPLFAFDATISRNIFAKRFVKTALFRFYEPRTAMHWFKVTSGFSQFFKNDRRHFPYMVGMDMPPNFVSLTTIFTRFLPPDAKRIFLKVDIEGSEYRTLDELVKFADRIEGLVIEFHDVDLHLERIKNFIAAFPLHLCHTHCNNYGVLDKNGTPLAIELSFTSRPLEDGMAEQFPGPLDMANRKATPDYTIAFY